MIAYEFSTQLTDKAAVIVPHKYARRLHKGIPLRVILLVDEQAESSEPVNETTQEAQVGLLSLEDLVAEIRRMGPNLNNITPASGLLAQHLREQPIMPDPDLDVEGWMKEWDRVEAEMKAASLAHEEAERQEWVQ